MELDMRLRQYGLKAEYQGPIIEDIDDLATLADAHANVACSQVWPFNHPHMSAYNYLLRLVPTPASCPTSDVSCNCTLLQGLETEVNKKSLDTVTSPGETLALTLLDQNAWMMHAVVCVSRATIECGLCLQMCWGSRLMMSWEETMLLHSTWMSPPRQSSLRLFQ